MLSNGAVLECHLRGIVSSILALYHRFPQVYAS
jgi:hypothetical protein